MIICPLCNRRITSFMQKFRNGTLHKAPVLIWDVNTNGYVPNYSYNQVKLYRSDKDLYTGCCYQSIPHNIIVPKTVKIKVYTESDIHKMTNIL